MSAHTPGPWTLEAGLNTTYVYVMERYLFRGKPCNRTSMFCDVRGNAPREERSACARLIAAAPELLAAVKAALAWPDEDEFGNAVDEQYTTPAYRAYRQSLRDAIAKAEGR